MTRKIEIVEEGIKRYVKKFYLIKTLQGLVISLALLGLVYLIIVVFQYYFYLQVSLKKLIFWSFIIFAGAVFVDFVFINIYKYFKNVPPLENFDAAESISKSFPEIKDKLVNILELYSQSKHKSDDLLEASINQKIDDIKFIDFSKAIDLKEVRRYAKYFLFVLLLFVFLLLFNKHLILEGNKKFVNYSTYYQPVAPFSFELLNDSLKVQENGDLDIKLKLTGDELPSEVYINYGGNTLPLSGLKQKNYFQYTFKNINKSFQFYFSAGSFKSEVYTVKVLPAPQILSFEIDVEPPAYTHKKSFKLTNTGDLLVPYGSLISFKFKANNADSVFIILDSVKHTAAHNKSFTYSFKALKSCEYRIAVKNRYFTKNLMSYNLTVIPDLYPKISVEQMRDTSVLTMFLFHGEISDDYGFTSLNFNYCVSENVDNPSKLKFKKLKIKFFRNQLAQDFYYIFDFNDLQISENKQVYYYFSVSDNDKISGFKTVKTPVFTYKRPGINEIDSIVSELDNNVSDKLEQASQLSFEIKNDIRSFNEKMLQENVSEWEKQSFLEDLLQKQQMLNNLLDSMSISNKEKIRQLEQMKNQNEELLKKQQEIQKLLDELLTDEMKKMLDSLSKLQEKFNNKEFDKLLKNFDNNTESLSKKLDVTQELLKRMQVEQKLENTKQKIDDLAKKMENLSESVKNSKKLTAEQQDSLLTLEEEFKNAMSEYDSLMKENQNLEKPYNLDSLNNEKEQINQDFEKTKEEMFKNNKNKTSKQMKNTADDMKKMSQKLSDMMESSMMSSSSEDAQTIKFLLSNLLSFSFDQENLYTSLNKNLSVFTDKYRKLTKKQLSLSDDFTIISDSLLALAKRNPYIATVVTSEVNNINTNLKLSNENLKNSKRKKALINQRYVISSVNKLALMLQESLQQMQNQMMSGGGSPKNSQNQPMPSMGDMMQMQQQLQQQLQEMMKKMQNGEMPGSEEFGKQMAEREMLQKMLNDMLNSGELSQYEKELFQEMMQLNDEIKSDLIDRNITPETLMRDKKIRTRLLEAEDAENKRKFSNKRKSNTGDDMLHEVSDSVIEKFKKATSRNEILQKSNLRLNNFYNQYYNEYIQRLTN